MVPDNARCIHSRLDLKQTPLSSNAFFTTFVCSISVPLLRPSCLVLILFVNLQQLQQHMKHTVSLKCFKLQSLSYLHCLQLGEPHRANIFYVPSNLNHRSFVINRYYPFFGCLFTSPSLNKKNCYFSKSFALEQCFPSFQRKTVFSNHNQQIIHWRPSEKPDRINSLLRQHQYTPSHSTLSKTLEIKTSHMNIEFTWKHWAQPNSSVFFNFIIQRQNYNRVLRFSSASAHSILSHSVPFQFNILLFPSEKLLGDISTFGV